MSEPKEPSLWLPTQDRVKLALLGKLIEECGELTSAAARCIIHGMDERSPDTGKVNRDWLADEMADVYALLNLIETTMTASVDPDRIVRKHDMKLKWLRMILAHEHGEKMLYSGEE